jgi:hypothetical protein
VADKDLGQRTPYRDSQGRIVPEEGQFGVSAVRWRAMGQRSASDRSDEGTVKDQLWLSAWLLFRRHPDCQETT